MDEQNAPLQAGNPHGHSDEVSVLRVIAHGLAATDPYERTENGEVCRYCRQSDRTHYRFCIWKMAQAWGSGEQG